jgi:membrane protease YdiL (CAAX protease family)
VPLHLSRHSSSPSQGPTAGNPFGIVEAAFGLAIGFLLSAVGLSVYDAVAHLPPGAAGFGDDVVSLFMLWTGFVGSAVVATRLHRPYGPVEPAQALQLSPDDRTRGDGPPSLPPSGSVRRDYGIGFRLLDLPLGVAVGVAAQYLLVPLLELPIEPFVSHFDERIGHPTQQLLGPGVSGGTARLVVISILVCVGSPLAEELFFRGLLLRGLLGRFRSLGPRLGPAVSVLITGVLFGLAHFEELQFLGLAGLGVVLSLLAWRTGRLGSSMIAHMAFNTVAVVSFVWR